MSDEAAFLDALRANPADDTARLVYADWLDEHGEPAKAEYLRLVVALARAEIDYARDQPDVARTLALAEALPAEWRAAAGSRFRGVFYAYRDNAMKIDAIKRIREISGRGLAEAKALCERPPSTIIPCVPFEDALVFCEYLCEAGHTARVHPSEVSALTLAVTYTVSAHRRNSGWELDDPEGEEHCITACATLLGTALGLGPEAARDLASTHEQVEIATGLTLFGARSLADRLRLLIPAAHGDTDWYLDVQIHPVPARPRI
jgi:uncharacterized protein (TIGR02996 family)